jgi:hypothetical protein
MEGTHAPDSVRRVLRDEMRKTTSKSVRARAEMRAVVGPRIPFVRVGIAVVAALSAASAIASLSTM